MFQHCIRAINSISGSGSNGLCRLFYKCGYVRQYSSLLHGRNILTNSAYLMGFKDNVSVNNRRQFSSESYIVQMRGLDWEAKEQDVIDFFKPLCITPKTVRLKCDISGRVSGLCEVEFATHGDAVNALRKKNAFIGNRFIRLSLKSTSSVEGDLIESDENNNSSSNFKGENDNKGNIDRSLFATGHFVRVKNLPTRITEQAIFEFFWPLNIKPTCVQPVYDHNGYRTGEFDVEFLAHENAVKAMSKNNAYFGQRNVEIELHSDANPVARPSIQEKLTIGANKFADAEMRY